MIDVPEGIRAERLEDGFWYEIDDEQDLDIAESIFTSLESRLQKRYGGYWRYPRMKDFCHLVNPFFSNQRLLDEMKASFERLVYSYPSGLEVNCLLVAKSLGLKKEHICGGNGAGELIRVFLAGQGGRIWLFGVIQLFNRLSFCPGFSIIKHMGRAKEPHRVYGLKTLNLVR